MIRLMLCLHISAISAFISAMIDVAQVYKRSTMATSSRADLAMVQGLIIAREIGFSLSFGSRFLFFWGFVGEATPGEPVLGKSSWHNGSWDRWGVLGMGLKWSSFSSTVAVLVLQVLFRVVNTLQKLGPVYVAESTVEIILSVIFILKLFLNACACMLHNPATVPGKMVLVIYLPMIMALSLGLWVSIGNLLSCARFFDMILQK